MNGDHDTGRGPDFARSVVVELELLAALDLAVIVAPGIYYLTERGREYARSHPVPR